MHTVLNESPGKKQAKRNKQQTRASFEDENPKLVSYLKSLDQRIAEDKKQEGGVKP